MHSDDIVIVGLIESDPVRNMRIPIYRFIKDDDVQRIVDEAKERGATGIQPLFTENLSNNKQMLAIMSGEFNCGPVTEEGVLITFPKLKDKIVATCRVPLPPAFGQATGWIAIHLRKWPPTAGLDQLKFDALNMSLAYFNLEIAKRGDIKVIK
jgi:hypothetical protein